eukprot:145952-Pleurochrysis_carterae.AAC.6
MRAVRRQNRATCIWTGAVYEARRRDSSSHNVQRLRSAGCGAARRNSRAEKNARAAICCARARAHGTSRRPATEIGCIVKRLTRARVAEEKEKELTAKIDTLNEQLVARGAAESVGAEAVARLAAMPITHATRTARSEGGLLLAFAVRTLAYGQLSRLTTPHAVGPYISAVVSCAAWCL